MRLTATVREQVRREFFPEDYPHALQILSRWDTKACAPGEKPSRMRSAVLALALGDLARLDYYIAAAKIDYRDVLYWAGGERLRYVFCEPSKTVPDPIEEAFLHSIEADPRDNAPRLIYADWLEERGDPRAGYLRLLCEWLACGPAEDQPLIERERELRAPSDRRWLARIRGMPVRDKTRRKEDAARSDILT